MGTLKTGRLDLNDHRDMESCKEALLKIASRQSSYYALRFKPEYYFELPGAKPPRSAGWYVMLEAMTQVYVGRSDNLNSRLNSNQGSTDNFAKKLRTSNSERNFVKKFLEIGHFKKLRECVFIRDEFSNQSASTPMKLLTRAKRT